MTIYYLFKINHANFDCKSNTILLINMQNIIQIRYFADINFTVIPTDILGLSLCMLIDTKYPRLPRAL